MIVKDYYCYIDKIAPFDSYKGYDNTGFLIGDLNAHVNSVMLCLDVTKAVIKEAIELEANLIIAHHPVIYNPLKKIETKTPPYELIKNNINVIAAHMNFDLHHMSKAMLFKLGFGKNDIETSEIIDEYGLIAELSKSISKDELLLKVKTAFPAKILRYTKGSENIKKIAVCSGAGDELLDKAIKKGADCFITGDVRRHSFVEAMNREFMLIDAGHYGTEFIFCDYLKNMLSKEFQSDKFYIAKSDIDAFVH